MLMVHTHDTDACGRPRCPTGRLELMRGCLALWRAGCPGVSSDFTD